MKPKVALVKCGFLPAGSENMRGRLSLAAHDKLAELAASGWDIDGLSVTKPTASTDSTAAPVVTKVSVDANRVADVPDERRPEANWQAHAYIGSRKVDVGMRTVCNTCGNSLNYCGCKSPLVWVDSDNQGVVIFSSRSNSLPVRKW